MSADGKKQSLSLAYARQLPHTREPKSQQEKFKCLDIRRVVNNDGILYQDKNRVKELLARNGLQLSTPLKISNSDIIIPSSLENVNSKKESVNYNSGKSVYRITEFSGKALLV